MSHDGSRLPPTTTWQARNALPLPAHPKAHFMQNDQKQINAIKRVVPWEQEFKIMTKIRYAVVGAGWISQEAFMPSTEQTGNSEMTAIVTGNVEKAKKLADFYGIKHIYTYDQYDAALKSGHFDAVYIALPNSMHADYSIRASKAGIHSLVEKPLAVTVEECKAMIAAAKSNGARLMTAYRLHNEPTTLHVLDLIRKGEIGEPRMFSSYFSYQADGSNHRLLAEHWGGPLQDIGVYCLNAVRHVFNDEPIEAIAMEDSFPGDARFKSVGEMYAATLRFPKGRIAQFFASFGAESVEQYRVVGTTGEIEVLNGYKFDTAKTVRLNKQGKVTEWDFPQLDHFSGQTAYFSECILNKVEAEADGDEGLNDVRVMLAIETAARTGKAQEIVSAPRPRHPSTDMEKRFPPTSRRLLV